MQGLRRELLCLQEEGLDTVDANRALGLPDDCREYSSVRNILADLGIRSIRLMVRARRAATARAVCPTIFYRTLASHTSS